MRVGAVALAVTGAGVLATAGCSTVLGIDPDRYLANDPVGSGDAPDAAADGAATPDWDCLDQPRGKVDPNQRLTVTLVVMDELKDSVSGGDVDGGSDLDTVDGDWLSGVSVRPCSLRDTECMEDGGGGGIGYFDPNAVLTDDAGRAPFDLPGDFAGFFEMYRADLVPATLYPGRMIPGENAVSFPVYTLKLPELDELFSQTGAVLDAGAGSAIITVYDCQDHEAAGVSLSYTNQGPNTVPFYFAVGLPNTKTTQTDDYGQAGAVNLPTGNVMVTAKRSSDQKTVGNVSFNVRPGGLSLGLIRARAH